jgi:ABC-type uncharacterized transport system substrate-binding protein
VQYTLGALRSSLGAATDENRADRIPNWFIPFLSGAKQRSISARPARAWLLEGKNIVIEWRSAEGNRDRQRALAAELVGLKVDVIVTSSGGDTRAAKEATATIPIVMASADDPVAAGFVDSLARPGGNITGLSTLSPETSGKRLELLKEVVPKLSRVAVFGTSSSPGNAQALKEIEIAAGSVGVTLQYLDVLTAKISNLHSVQQLKRELTRSLRSYRAPSAVLAERSWQNSR